MDNIKLTFSEDVMLDLLDLLGKTIDNEGYLAEKDDQTQRVLTKEGEEIHIDEWGGIIKGRLFIKKDLTTLMEIARITREGINMKYYSSVAEAEKHRRKNGRIYYKSDRGYYITYPKKKNWWDIR